MPKKTNGNYAGIDRDDTLHMRLPKSLKAQLKSLAVHDHRTLSDIVIICLEYGIEGYNQKAWTGTGKYPLGGMYEKEAKPKK